MAFFSNGRQEYFSFNLHPEKSENCFLFPLNNFQSNVSLYALPVCMVVSILVFVTVSAIACAESMGWNALLPGGADQDLLMIALTGITTIVAGSEIMFFIWVKISSKPLSAAARKQLRPLHLQRAKSRTAYASFLLSMLAPIIGLGALPGGFEGSARGLFAEDGFFLFFLLQVGLAIVALSIFLARRIVVLGHSGKA